MSAADHLTTALEYAGHANRWWFDGHLEAARTAAEIGRLHLDLHRELWLTEVDLPPTDLGIAAPVLDLPTYADKKKPPAIGDVKDCEYCGTSITAVPSNGTLLWAETDTSHLHDCPPSKHKKAPASPGKPTGANDTNPHQEA